MAGTGRWEFVDINEKSFVGITWVVGKHTVVNVFLGTFAVVAWSEETAGRIWVKAGFKTGSLGVVMDFIDNDTPVTVNISGTFWHGVFNIGGAKVAFWSDPMTSIIRGFAFGGTGIITVIKSVFLVFGNMVDQIIS